jgi:hypothetical protein
VSDDATTGGMPAPGGKPDEAASTQTTESTGAAVTAGEGEKPKHTEDTTALKSALQRERDARSAAEAQLKAIRDKDLPEGERAKRDLEAATQETGVWKGKYLKSAVGLAAASLGFANPNLADALLVDTEGPIAVDDNGEPTGIETGLRKLLRENPGLASATVRATGTIDGGVRGTARTGGTDMNALIRGARGHTVNG